LTVVASPAGADRLAATVVAEQRRAALVRDRRSSGCHPRAAHRPARWVANTLDPLRGGTVIAIFDMGAHQPFVVWWQQEPGNGEVREVLDCNAYSVLDFDG
jgi:hypothetical protein